MVYKDKVRGAVAAAILASTLCSMGGYATAADLKLRFTSFEPEAITGHQAKRFGDEIAKKTNGEIELEYYWAGSLLPASQMASGIASGIADIGMILPPYNPSEFPVANWASLLGSLVSTDFPASMLQASAANAEVILSNEDLAKEFERQGLVILTPLFAYPSFDLLCSTPVTTLDEAKGKRVRVGGNLWAAEAQAVGMEPVALPGSDVYQAAQRGMVDCVMQHPPGFVGNSVWEVVKHYTPVQFTGWNAMYLVMGREKWNSLTEDQRGAILSSAATYFVSTHQKSMMDYAEFAGDGADKQNVEFHQPDPAFAAAIKSAAETGLMNSVSKAPAGLSNAEGFVTSYKKAMEKWSDFVGQNYVLSTGGDIRSSLSSGKELDLTKWDEQVRTQIFNTYKP